MFPTLSLSRVDFPSAPISRIPRISRFGRSASRTPATCAGSAAGEVIAVHNRRHHATRTRARPLFASSARGSLGFDLAPTRLSWQMCSRSVESPSLRSIIAEPVPRRRKLWPTVTPLAEEIAEMCRRGHGILRAHRLRFRQPRQRCGAPPNSPSHKCPGRLAPDRSTAFPCGTSRRLRCGLNAAPICRLRGVATGERDLELVRQSQQPLRSDPPILRDVVPTANDKNAAPVLRHGRDIAQSAGQAIPSTAQPVPSRRKCTFSMVKSVVTATRVRGNAQHGAVVADAGNQSTGQPPTSDGPPRARRRICSISFFHQGHADPNIPASPAAPVRSAHEIGRPGYRGNCPDGSSN